MGNSTVERVSGLEGYYHTGRFGANPEATPGIVLQEINQLTLWQVAVWPEAFAEVAKRIATDCGAKAAPKPGQSVVGKKGIVLRAEPLKFWVLGMTASELNLETEGCIVDQSHSRTRIRVSGDDAVTLLNRHLPLDLRDDAFPVGAVGSTAFHHIGITLWRNEDGYDIFMPRGFALSLWELLTHSAEQFGLETLPV
ncbi:MAG: heterotetrameric sarcosine oxidase gamma subunit [Saprospiraceae bacterium]|jgi:heterotetrameric sarcosine oxidase gamma subunit